MMKNVEPLAADLPLPGGGGGGGGGAAHLSNGMPSRTPKTTPKNLTGLYLGLEGANAQERPRHSIPPLARGRGMSMRVRTPTEERRYRMVELLRDKEETRGFVGNPLRSCKNRRLGEQGERTRPSRHTGPQNFNQLIKKTPRNFTAVSNSGVTHLEYLGDKEPPPGECVISAPCNEVLTERWADAIAEEVHRISTKPGISREELTGLEDCYKKVCNSNVGALHSLLPHRKSKENTRDLSKRYSTGFAVKSYRTPNQAEIIAHFDHQERPKTVGMRASVPSPYFFRAYNTPKTAGAVRSPRIYNPAYEDDTVEGLHGSTKVLASPAAGATTTTATSSRGLSRSKTQLTSSSSTVPEGAGGRPSSPVNLSTNSRSPGAGIQGDQRTASDKIPVTLPGGNYTQGGVADSTTAPGSSQNGPRSNSNQSNNSGATTAASMAELEGGHKVKDIDGSTAASVGVVVIAGVEDEEGGTQPAIIDEADEEMDNGQAPLLPGLKAQPLSQRMEQAKNSEQKLETFKKTAEARQKELEQLLDEYAEITQIVKATSTENLSGGGSES